MFFLTPEQAPKASPCHCNCICLPLSLHTALFSPSVPWDTPLDSGKEEPNSVTKLAGVANISECSHYIQTKFMLKILTYIREKSGW